MHLSSETKGYCIRTYRLILECEHPEWLLENQKRCRELQQFYYNVLLEHPQLLDLGSRQILRELEKLTVSSGKGPAAEFPLPWQKIPAYFRRSVINAVTAAVKSIRTRSEGRTLKTEIQNSVVFYQRMYRNFTGRRISLHIWNGEAWVWMDCRLHGGRLPDPSAEGIKWMSPAVVWRKDHVFLHVPVREPVADARRLKQRVKDGERLCAVQFMNTDCFAVMCVLDAEGRQTAARYVKGGARYVHRCGEILEHIRISRDSCGSRGQPKADQKYWMKLKHQREYWAHKVSREILDFCAEQKVRILTWEEYAPDYSKAVLKKSGSWSALHLSSRVKEYLNYKAWQEGILIAPVKSFQIKERRFTEGEKNIQRARIAGRQCLANLRRTTAEETKNS